jgi:hypothetical protein
MENLQVIGYPFVSHVDQDWRPTIEVVDFLNRSYGISNYDLISHGYYKLMGYLYDFKPYLKRFIYKQYGSWQEAYAPNKTTLRKVIYGRIDEIIELKK